MVPHEQDSGVPGSTKGAARPERGFGRSIFVRSASQRPGLLALSLITGFVAGLAYRAFVNDDTPRDLANFLRSGSHGVGLAAAVWAVQIMFASNARSSLGSALRRLPLAGEIVVRSLVMTAVLIIVGVSLQFAIYAEPLHLQWLTRTWFTTTLPRIVAIGFGMSLVLGVVAELGRLVGSQLLASVVLGTYHRPVREQLIVMFLDLAGSTRLAEDMGELLVHDIITRFFFDIDEPISDNGGSVHAYVGDEVIVTWPVSSNPETNTRCLKCFFAIERTMACLAIDYSREFNVAPGFRAGLHAGPVIVSECGDTKRQLAYFGDTMNVAARLCDYCKAINERLIISGDLLRQVRVPADLEVGAGESIALRGRQERIETHAVRSVFSHSSD